MRYRRATERELAILDRGVSGWRGPRLAGGIPKKQHLRPDDFDWDQLAIGTAVELEHTKRPTLALEIAMAHLAERSDYYAKLERLEKSPKPRRRRSS